MIEEIPIDQLVRKGSMVKAPWLMNDVEYAAWKIRVQSEASDYLFSIGQPLVYEKDGVMVSENADGSIDQL